MGGKQAFYKIYKLVILYMGVNAKMQIWAVHILPKEVKLIA